MPRARIRQPDFTAGELSPRAEGRIDVDRYYRGAKRLENFVLLPVGAITRRPGTRFVVATKASGAARLIPFEVSSSQAYILEIGVSYIRFFANAAQVTSGGAALEIVSPYVAADLPLIDYAQSADVLYLTCAGYAPRKLVRLTTSLFKLETITFAPGPSQVVGEAPATTGTPAAVSGAGINFTAGAASFLVSDVGRRIEVTAGVSIGARALITGFTSTTVVVVTIESVFADTAAIASGSWKITDSPLATVTPSGTAPVRVGTVVTLTAGANAWKADAQVTHVGKFVHINGGVVEVTGVTSATVADGTVRSELIATLAGATTSPPSPPDAWTLEDASWSAALGFPEAVAFSPEDRLMFARGEQWWASKTGDYENFATGALDDDALDRRLRDSKVNTIQYIEVARDHLFLTTGSEYAVNGGTGPLTPSNVGQSRSDTHYGAAKVKPVRAGNVVLFVTRGGRQLRELVFDITPDQYVAEDMTLLADHLFEPLRINRSLVQRDIKELAFAREPTPLVWARRQDGALCGMTYLRSQNIVGWHRHITGTPTLDARGHAYPSDGTVESIAVIPHPTEARSQLWLIVNRTINGATARYVEYLDDDGLCYVGLNTDSSLTYDGTVAQTLTAPGLTGAGAFIAGGAAFAAGDVGKEIREFTGFGRATITQYVNATQVIATIVTAFSALTFAASEWGLAVFTLSGLDHLEGQTVQVVGDGAYYGEFVVASGVVTLTDMAAVQVEVGLPYVSTLTTIRPELPQLGSQGLRKRITRALIRLFETVGLTLDGDTIPFRSVSDPMNRAVPLFSGDKEITRTGIDADGRVTITQALPLPCTILLVGGPMVQGE